MIRGRALWILFSTLFLLMLSVGIIIPNIAYRAQELDASALSISLLFSLYSLMQFLFAPFWGHLSDRVGRRPVLLIGLVGNGLGLIFFGLSADLPWLYAARGLSGLMSSAALPTAMAYIADVTDDASRGRGMGLMGAAMGLGFIFGPGIGGALSRFGHAVPFLVAGALNLATCAAAALFLKESLVRGAAPPAPAPLSSAWQAARGPLRPFYLVAFLVPFAMAALETTFPLIIKDQFGYGAQEMGLMFLFMGSAVFLVQAFLLARWIQAMGEENVLLWGLLINAAGFLLVITAAGKISLTAALVVGGAGNQVMRPTNASLITKRTRQGQGLSIGVMDSFDSLGRILGPILAGALYPPDPRYPCAASALILVAASVMLRARRSAMAGAAPEVPRPDGA
jgi:multidrug resistance protein